jgi:hypothetical protein
VVDTAEPRQGVPGSVIWLALLVVGALCVGGIVVSTKIAHRGTEPSAPVPSVPTQPTHSASPALSAATATVTGGAGSSFDLRVGTAVRFTDQDGTWTVALLGVEWIDQCEDFLGDSGGALVVDIRYKVLAGAVSIVPITDFAYVGADGVTAHASFLTGCADPPLDYTVISTGAVSRGEIAFSVPSNAGGTLTYGQLGPPTASWTIPAT